MRILQSAALEGRSAGSEYALVYSRALKESGHAVYFLTVPKSQTYRRARESGLETVDAIDLSERKLAFLRNLPKLKGAVDAVKPDVVLAHWGPDHVAWGWTLRNTKIPLLRVRSHSPLLPNRNLAARWLARRTAFFIVGNSGQRRQYVEQLGVPAGKIEQIPFGIRVLDYPFSSTPPPSGRAIRILQLGRFSPVKGHGFLFQSLGKLKSQLQTPYRLTVAGFEAELKSSDLQAWKEEAGLTKEVEIRPNVADVRPLLAQCDFGIVASTGSEATARVALEFMATGRPLLASRVGVLPEIVNGASGWLFQPGDFDSFAAAWKQVLACPAQYVEMGRAGRARVEAEYDLPRLAARLESVLHGVVSRA